MKVMKILEFQANITNITKTLEFHERITKIMKILEFQNKYENHVNLRIS